MNNRLTSGIAALPIALKYNDVRSYVLTFTFVCLTAFLPWLFHQFHLAGATFLPMHFFVLVAGLLFGWRAGLIVGLLSPLASYSLAGMPALWLLPQITIELTACGFIVGFLREKFKLKVIWSLLAAITGGRLALLLVTSLIYLITGQISSPLGPESNPFLVVWSAVGQGWPGIVIQLVSIPFVFYMIDRSAKRNRPLRYE